MKTETVCPLGSKCEEAKDGAVYRCAWFIKLVGKNPQTGQEIDEWGCSMAWLPVLLIENASTNRGQTAAIESFRNEMVRDNQILLTGSHG
jgi:hypothetical protein